MTFAKISLSLFALPCMLAYAQGGGGSANNLPSQVTTLQTQVNTLQAQVATLQTQVSSLQTSVAKLNGQISASDLVGTYAVYGIQNELRGTGDAGHSASVGAYVYAGTLTFNGDFSGSASLAQTGHYLNFGTSTSLSGTAVRTSTDGTFGPISLTWIYNNGVITVSGLGSPVSFSVAAGGRVLVTAGANHTDGTDVLLIMVRL